MLGVRIECAQCHDHPFSAWKMEDFWGIAAFFSEIDRPADAAGASKATKSAGEISFGDKTYRAKLLWQADMARGSDGSLRQQLGRWMTSTDNPNFAATMVNRMWQNLVGRGLFVDVENLDTAKPEQRKLLDEFGKRFAANGYDVRRLTAAICKSNWYQAISQPESTGDGVFYRPLKSMPADQVFDALEQSLHLPISRIDPNSPRWTGARLELVNRLNESGRRAPDEYAAGIPQALMLMNGRMINQATDLQSSRLLRAVIDSPFLNKSEQVETLYLASCPDVQLSTSKWLSNSIWIAHRKQVCRIWFGPWLTVRSSCYVANILSVQSSRFRSNRRGFVGWRGVFHTHGSIVGRERRPAPTTRLHHVVDERCT